MLDLLSLKRTAAEDEGEEVATPGREAIEGVGKGVGGNIEGVGIMFFYLQHKPEKQTNHKLLNVFTKDFTARI